MEIQNNIIEIENFLIVLDVFKIRFKNEDRIALRAIRYLSGFNINIGDIITIINKDKSRLEAKIENLEYKSSCCCGDCGNKDAIFLTLDKLFEKELIKDGAKIVNNPSLK